MAKEIRLSVEEAKHRDAGRGIARIDKNNMQELNIVSGDIVEIKGKKIAAAIVWPGYPEDSSKNIIKIDGDIRSNAGVGINDKVKIKKIEAKKAKEIMLTPLQSVEIVRENEYLLKVLEGIPVIKGQRVRVEMLGSPLTFAVTATQPSGVIIITKDTKISLKKPREEGVQITYEDIGGLKREIGLVREMIELPLRHPELFQEIGIDPPKGVLLYGPPGTGKTLLAKAVADESDANFFSINGPEIIAKYYGDSEERLREIFEEAEKNAPSIIFIDEIDSIASKRSEMSGDRQLERRVVSQLLGLMDGLKARGKVVVVAATNQPDMLDEALRRGGRFDREIEIGIPDKEGRKEVLQVHTRGMPLAKEVKLKELADITHGFVGADLFILCKEAGMHALRKILPEIDINKIIPADIISRLEITKEDFYEALKGVEPSALREVYVEIPDIKWEDIGGLEKAKQELIETVEWPLKYPELYEYSKTKTQKGILLYGPPGTGKTLLAKAVANESEINFISVKGPELISKFVGESEKRLREIFRKAKQASPCILFFDELDAVAPKRGARTDSGVSERFVSQLLTEMDGIEVLKNVIVIGASNRKDLIDEALLRPGRFDRLIFIHLPNKKTRLEIFKIHVKEKPLANDVDLEKLAERTEDFSGADIEAVCVFASKLAIREFIQDRKEEAVKKEVKKFKICNKHFESALKETESKKEDKMRKLILIPIVHTPADMGSMKDALKEKGIEKLGKKAWEENEKKIGRFWDEVEKTIDKLDLESSKVRIYQDGMPEGGEFALKIVNATAAKGSRNYQIIKKLIEGGAKIEETESKELLLKEYNYAKEFAKASNEEEKTEAIKEFEKVKDSLIKERDKFIAEKINSGLKDDEIGILFIGAHHDVTPYLSSDIVIKNL
ncbi:MAG: CDC48 family AAA ATPase [Nanoarchaeota archaeon]|nr:CDC48 family AAA ATPase [Nanoarchaeota archaeon]